MKEWPADDKPVSSFQDIVEPLQEAARFARNSPHLNVPYDGYDVGEILRPDILNALWRLTHVYQLFRSGSQDPDPVNEIIELSVQVGIEQGRRLTRSGGFDVNDANDAVTGYLEAMDVPVDPEQLRTILEDVRRRKLATEASLAASRNPAVTNADLGEKS